VWTNLQEFNPTYGYNAEGSSTHVMSFTPSYGLDGDGVGAQYTPLPESRVKCPTDMIAIGDYPELPRQDGDIAAALDDADDYVADRHSKGANVAFCDAHVEFGKQTNWMKAADNFRKRWNNDNQPHPETWH
jgi:prepilin-type processing-associated H-X9-DG protein